MTIPIKVITKFSEYTVQFNNDINLINGVDYKIGLVWFETTNAIFNITKANNQFKYSNNKSVWKTISITNGGYEIREINSRIEEALIANGDFTPNSPAKIIIGVDVPTLRTTIKLEKGYKVDFKIANSLRLLLGFDSIIVDKEGLTYSNNIANITETNTINLECSIVSDFYVNGEKTNLLFSAPIPVPIAYTFRLTPQNIIYLPLNVKSFNQITFRIVNEGGKIINFNGATIQYLVVIEQI